MQTQDLKKFFDDIRSDEDLTNQLISLLVQYEIKFQKDDGFDIREKISGPIVDTLFKESNKTFDVTLKDGIKFKFTYKSKIMRDFLLRRDPEPDHFWEPQTTKLLKLLCSTSKSAVVGGAYIGDQVVYIGKSLQQNDGICYAFEPNRDSYNLLQTNCSLNNLTNVVSIQKGLWYQKKNLTFVGEDSHASSAEANKDSTYTFEATSINSYCEENNVNSIDLIMLDLEGGELNVLKGATNFLKKDSNSAPIVIFEIHKSYVDWSNGLEKTDIGVFLMEHGYHLFAIRDFQSNYPMVNKKIELIPAQSVILDGPSHGFNMIALKNLELLNNQNIQILQNLSPKLLLHRDKKIHYPLN